MTSAAKSKRASRAKWICAACMYPHSRWPGPRCRACGAFAASVVEIGEARARGIALPMSMLGEATKASRTRYATGLRGFDRILSREGGVVPAASVLLASVPGGGKTTLLLAAAGHAARRQRVVYASAEQDEPALRALAEKLDVADRSRLVPTSIRTLDNVEVIVRRMGPRLVIIDSATEVAKHARTQPQAIVAAAHELAHDAGVAIILTAHVNREGLTRGGPELEHATDTVLMLTGDPRASPMRELSVTKNRHGDTTLMTRLRMTAHGFEDVRDDGPAMPQRALGVGAALGLVRDGEGRAQLVEVQAAIVATANAASANVQRRITCSGCSPERVRVIAATIDREVPVPAGDLVVRVYGEAGGDAGQLDAAIAGAIVSAARGQPLPPSIVLAGELALDGTLRSSGDVESEAAKLALRLVGRPGDSLVGTLGRARLRAV